jgi:carboxymethylenebutenolidase
MAGRYVTIKAADGGEFKAYTAKPAQGSGPGLLVIQEIFGVNQHIRDICDYYAEEGYVTIAPDIFWRMEPGVELGQSDEDMQRAFGFYGKFDVEKGMADIAETLKALRALPECKGKVGSVGYCLGGFLSYLTACRADVDLAVCYYGVGIEKALGEAKNLKTPVVMHFAELDQYASPAAVQQIREHFKGRPEIEIYNYPGTDHAFNRLGGMHYDKPAAMMAYSRSLAAFRRVMGPHYDLSALWDAHTMHEFGTRDVDATMKTMVAEPYVNHIPTMTGGVGHDHLKRFYKHHFIPKCPKDTHLVPISRTIGADRVVDEMLFCFTHDMEIDWMLPGVPPSGKYVEIPLVAIVNFRGDKLYHEHIYWDQASVLVQIGKLDPKNLPVAGIETAKKLVDEKLPSNTLMKNWAQSA